MNIRRFLIKQPLKKLFLRGCIYVIFFIIIFLCITSFMQENIEEPQRILEACPIPDFTYFSEYSKIISTPQQIRCPISLKLVTISKGIVHVRNDSICQYECIEWDDDRSGKVKEKNVLVTGAKVPCPFFITTCSINDSEKEYRDLTLTVDRNSNILSHASCKAVFEMSDILIIGVSSLSYNAWKHMLPLTFKTFHESIGGISFKKFNTLGDGITANLHALLTGTKDTEVYESRKRIFYNEYIDKYNWIWNHFKKKGYISSFIDDNADFGIFQYRLRGFKDQPTDYYMRPALVTASRNNLLYRFCLPSTTLQKAIFNFQHELNDIYSQIPKFSMIQLSKFSRKDNLKYLDDDLAKFIMEAKQKNPNLFLVLYSDDGKFMERKVQMIDKYEERLPFMGISLPNSLEDKREILKRNSKFLTTSFDLHATFEDLIGIYRPIQRTRHMSLLRPISEDRKCSDLDIASHWCSCFNWMQISDPINDPRIKSLAEQLTDIINSKTKIARHLCTNLTLDKIIEADKMSPTSDVLKFQRTSDPDGFIPEFSSTTQELLHWYRIKIMVQPGNGIFTATLVSAIANYNNPNIHSILYLPSKEIIRENNDPALVKCLHEEYIIDTNNLKEIKKYCICNGAKNLINFDII